MTEDASDLSADLDELRREKRHQNRHAILVSYPSQDGSGIEEKHTCRTEDVSEGGLKVVTRRALPLGCVLPIEVSVDDRAGAFRFNGEVKWCLEIDEAPTYFAGIKLLNIIGKGFKEWQALVGR